MVQTLPELRIVEEAAILLKSGCFSCFIWQVVLNNEGSAEKTFSFFSFEEWCLWDAQDVLRFAFLRKVNTVPTNH